MAIKTPQGSIIDTPRGTRDLNTSETIALNNILSVVEETFKRFGFSPITTPALENTAVLNAKAYGDEPTKEMYLIEGGDTALRFDMSVPLARFMAMNKDIPLPFKRYQIGWVWRKDEPQFMRAREFMHADADIVGSSAPGSDAECIAAILTALEALGTRNYTLLINSRPILEKVLKSCKIPDEKVVAAIRIIDKMAPVSTNDTITQLVAMGIGRSSAEELIAFITEKETNDAKLQKLQINMPESKQDAENLSSIISLLGNYGLSGTIKVDFSLARGLDYYTGGIWEVIVEAPDGGRMPSIGSGGRYDKLIGMYSKTPLPAVGASLGITRIFELLKGNYSKRVYSDVLIAQIGKDTTQYALGIAAKLRQSGAYVDMNVTEKGISKQLEYANSLGIRYVVIIGKKEKDANKANLKDMKSGTEQLLDIDALIEAVKK